MDVAELFFQHVPEICVDRIVLHESTVLIEAHAVVQSGACPGCGTESLRVHGNYRRRLDDVSTAGHPVQITLTMRRFLCLNPTCRKRTFAAQVDGLTNRYARITAGLLKAWQAIALACGGRGGSRLAAQMMMPSNRMRLIRLIRAMPDPDQPTPTVLGVDDFAFRKGRIYGTILIDMLTRRPVDVLPDREAATLAAWLREHPQVQIICRDRASAYAEAARIAAPGAIEVADRWHLWSNLCQAVHKTVVQHRACLNDPVPGSTSQPPESPATARLRERYDAVHAMLAKGIQRQVIAANLGLHPDTVARYAETTSFETLAISKSRTSKLDPYASYLDQRWNEGCTDAVRLTKEIRQQGYRGTERTVRRYLEPYRAAGTPASRAPKPTKPRQVTSWITRHPDEVSESKRLQLKAIRSRCPELDRLTELVVDFAKILCNRQGNRLPAWLQAAENADLPDLAIFAAGLRRDIDAVTNGLTLPWNSGPVEGTVCKLKAIKRAMFGRANFDLLRKRVLLHQTS